MTDDDPLLTTGQLAHVLGVSTMTISRWSRDGVITPASRTVGRHYRWRLGDVRRQLREHEERREDDPFAGM